jgi:hypothetical protein
VTGHPLTTADGVTVAVILPNWNGAGILERCLRSILDQDIDLELVVVDNGSTDGSADSLRRLESEEPRLRCHYNRDNRLFAAACNQAWEMTTAELVVVANNDVEPRPGVIHALVGHAVAYPGVGIVSPRFMLPDGRFQEAYRRLPTVLFMLAHYHRLGRAVDRLMLGRRIQNRYFYRDLVLEGTPDVEQAGASFNLVRRSAVVAAGGLFDERFPLLFNDVDLYRRVRAAGYRSVVLPEAVVIHHDGVASRAMDRRLYLEYQRTGMLRYFRKHHPLRAAALGLVWPGRWLASLRRPGEPGRQEAGDA